MRRFRLALTLALAAAAVTVLTAAVQAAAPAASRPLADPARDRLAQGPTFTRIQTVTLLPSAIATATALTTIWENTWIDVGFPFGFPLPSDYTTVTVEGATYEITQTEPITTTFGEVYTISVNLAPLGGGQPMKLRYYTNSRAIRDGNQYRIFIRATSPQTSTYATTVLFDDAVYEFVNFDRSLSDTLPLAVPNHVVGRVWWNPLTVTPRDRFDKFVVLADPRLPVDLTIQLAGAQLAPDRRSATVTAVVVNQGSISASNYFLVELYDRPFGSPAPSGPNDHSGGACRDPLCAVYRPANFAYFFGALAPSATTPFTFNYPFETGGTRTLYLQVDTFGWGGAVGLILEVDDDKPEYNNITRVGDYKAVGNLYLPLVLKNR
jgi:hypothetical protein